MTNLELCELNIDKLDNFLFGLDNLLGLELLIRWNLLIDEQKIREILYIIGIILNHQLSDIFQIMFSEFRYFFYD